MSPTAHLQKYREEAERVHRHPTRTPSSNRRKFVHHSNVAWCDCGRGTVSMWQKLIGKGRCAACRAFGVPKRFPG